MRESEQRFETFFKASYSLFYFTAFHLLGDEERSRDVVSECFAKAWAEHSDAPVSQWKAYMYNAVRNKCIDIIRRDRVRQRFVEFYMAMTPVTDEGIDDELELLERIYKTIATLPGLTRTVLHKCYFEGKKYKEVARELGISESYVKKNIMLALRTLRANVVKKQ